MNVNSDGRRDRTAATPAVPSVWRPTSASVTYASIPSRTTGLNGNTRAGPGGGSGRVTISPSGWGGPDESLSATHRPESVSETLKVPSGSCGAVIERLGGGAQPENSYRQA
ncbi:hypothetical protein DSM104329_01315 [Capillimicrobium parvum]|uniref:Uncharacterized protein n=1 Tax=Capillimicrobium parvum TaxID=2884022 RepID=A0A9E7C021_9ACTN|nr:hypothetical protein DSM104329_01315 [Capillimicrobium parvum]